MSVFLFSFSSTAHASLVSAGTILSSYKYAWSNNAAYINFENVVVSDDQLSGFAWSANYGWIKFNPVQGGVVNDGTGNLSGSAWGEKLGWIDFDGVSINGSTGKFSGTATGALVGTINFDCPNYCDVRTDWRQATTPVASSGGGSGGGSGVSVSPPISVNNTPLVLLPQQSGTLIQDTLAGEVVLEVPQNTIPNKTTFIISVESLLESKNHLVVDGTTLVNGVFFDISAKDENGNDIHFFSTPITITLPMSLDLTREKNLAVYWLNETNWQWVLIPDAVFSDGKVTLTMSHLTKFAIFATKDLTTGMPATTIPSLPLAPDKKPPQTSTTINQNDSERSATNTGDNSKSKLPITGHDWNLVLPLAILILIFLSAFLWKKRKGKYY